MNINMPHGISDIYFYNESKNIYATLPPNKEQAKRLSKRIYIGAITAIFVEEKGSNLSHKLRIIVRCIADNRLSNSIPFGLSDTI